MEDNSKLDLLNTIMEKNLNWIVAADTKISHILTINTAMLGVLAALAPKSEEWFSAPTLITLLTVLLLIVSTINLIVANYPRLSGPKGSLIYFGGISSLPREKYLETILSFPIDDLLKDLATQIHRNAEIAQTKFMYVKRAMNLLYVAIPLFLSSVYLLYNINQSIVMPCH